MKERAYHLPYQPRLRFVAGLALVCALALPLLGSWYVAAMTADQRHTVVAQVPQQRVAIVFGAGIRPDGRLTRMLAERVQAASNLYQAGRDQKLLMTGDNGSAEYDEVTAMKRYAVQLGVRAEDITLDYAGFSTYESCVRAREIFGVRQAVLVTQRFHLPRAVYTCQALGIAATGLGTPDWGAYREALLIRYTIRESLATLKALWQLHITRPDPTFLGPFEGIAGHRQRNAGSHMYHAHHNSTKQVSMGLLGAFIVEPQDRSNEPKVEHDYVVVLNDTAHGYTWNGKGFPATQPLTAKLGHKIRIRFMNEGMMIHPMHLHGLSFLVIAKDGYPQQPSECDTLNVAPGERWDVVVDCDNPGVWTFHCHILAHAENEHGMFGMVNALIVEA